MASLICPECGSELVVLFSAAVTVVEHHTRSNAGRSPCERRQHRKPLDALLTCVPADHVRIVTT